MTHKTKYYVFFIILFFFLHIRLVEWLDEYYPGSFRQAQVSFSTRIPGAFPLGDATTMSTAAALYHTAGLLLHVRQRAAKPPDGSGHPGKLLKLNTYRLHT